MPVTASKLCTALHLEEIVSGILCVDHMVPLLTRNVKCKTSVVTAVISETVFS